MTRAEKEDKVAALNEELKGSMMSILTDFRGVDVNDMTALRKTLRDNSAKYVVVKNTLAKLAAKDTEAEPLFENRVGPTGLAYTTGDPAALAKTLKEFAKNNDAFELGEGVLSGKVLTVKEVEAIADLPSKEELLAKVLGSINAPAQNVYNVIKAPARDLVSVLDAISKKEAS